jgi:hypothetical protein
MGRVGMSRVGVVRLSSKVPPRAGTVCAFLSWFVSIVGLNRLPERPGGELFTRGNTGGPTGTLPTLGQPCLLILQLGRWCPFGPPRPCLVDRLRPWGTSTAGRWVVPLLLHTP